MELRQIKYFCAVAEELSFARASLRLSIVQPALSIQIRSLEEELGTRLLERTTRKVVLTHSGKIFLQEARDILQRVTGATQSVKEAEAGIIGTLRLGYVSAFATVRLGSVLRSFRKQFPRLKLSLVSSEPWTLQEMLHADKIDVAVLRPPIASSALTGAVIGRSRMIVAVPKGSALAKKKRLDWKDFHEQPMVRSSLSEDIFYHSFLDLCERAGAFPKVTEFADDLPTKFWLISSGAGFSPTSDTAVELFSRPGLLFRSLPKDAPMIETVAVWRANEKQAHVLRLIQALRAT